MSDQNQAGNANQQQNLNQQPQAPTNNAPLIKQPTQSERFTQAVEREFASNAGEFNLTSYQRKLIQNYFIKVDMVLKDAEVKRLGTQESKREPLSYEWANLNMAKLAVDVITFSAVGLDPTQPNHLNPIPYKNKHTNKYDINFLVGYKGTEIKARKYGLMVPDEVVVELVYANDKFIAHKKDRNNKIDAYEFQIVNAFDRGAVIGGFYYHDYFADPQRNTLETFTRADIEKRKPKYASAEFWGGEKDKWEGGQKVGRETIEGWFDEMAYKTIYKAAWNCITIDSEKIDEHYLKVIQRESESRDETVHREIEEKANRTEIGFTDAVVVPQETVVTSANQQPVQHNTQAMASSNVTGPGF